ncbi:hypothetical protein J6590_018201 [Homalodisca vitripennis]|nr:hypothetical protein J6590_018201 [Homalodisca vitripennis]
MSYLDVSGHGTTSRRFSRGFHSCLRGAHSPEHNSQDDEGNTAIQTFVALMWYFDYTASHVCGPRPPMSVRLGPVASATLAELQVFSYLHLCSYHNLNIRRAPFVLRFPFHCTFNYGNLELLACSGSKLQAVERLTSRSITTKPLSGTNITNSCINVVAAGSQLSDARPICRLSAVYCITYSWRHGAVVLFAYIKVRTHIPRRRGARATRTNTTTVHNTQHTLLLHPLRWAGDGYS